MGATTSNRHKIIVIVGATAVGKTALGVYLAKKFNGEIVSADSRQIYKGLDIGTAKPEGHWEVIDGARRYVFEGIVHHLVDERDPKEEFSLLDFKKRAVEAIEDIVARGKTPFLVGGTGQYIYALLENWQIPEVAPNMALRARMEKYSAKALDEKLRNIDPDAAAIADMNPRRLIRALELYEQTGKKPTELQQKGPELFKTLMLGIPVPEQYEKKIQKRIETMVERGLLDEITALAKKYSWNLPAMQSIDYYEFRHCLEGTETLEQAQKKAVQDTLSFSKRQMTWFKRDKDIHWVNSFTEAEKLVGDFII